MPSPRVAHCVFCDDIRQEIGNKLSLMGLYVADINIVGKPPMALPKFAIVVWIISDIDDPPERITTRVLMPPDRKEAIKIEMNEIVKPLPQTAEGATKLIAHQIIPIYSFLLESAGMIEVMVETERGSLRAGRLAVHFVDPTPGVPAASDSSS